MNIVIPFYALNIYYDDACTDAMGHQGADESNDFANMYDGCAFE